METLLPYGLRPRKGFLRSFKNRILISALLVLIGVVLCIGVMLQVYVFPQLKGDAAAIQHIKAIHLLTSLVVIGISWAFVEMISKRITLPLLDLTQRADQISREAGAGLTDSKDRPMSELEKDGAANGDEIAQLTTAFNRMLLNLKAAENLLRESESKYRFLFDSGPSPIFLVDAETMAVIDVNAKAEEEYQYTKDELLAMSFADLGRNRDRVSTSAQFKNIFSTEVTLLPVLEHRRKDGTPFMVNFQASMTSYMDRPAVIAAVWDVTESLKRYTKLIQAGKMATLGEMATGIAHELNQPLSVIKIGCDYLVKKGRRAGSLTFEELTAATNEIEVSVERATKIIDHLRQFGRRTDQQMTPVSINDPIRDVFFLLGRQMKSAGVTIDLDLDESIPKVLGEPNRLQQVFINLALNARDAMTKRRQPDEQGVAKPNVLTVRSFIEGGRIVVSVSDTGPGIPEALRAKIFEPFYTTKEVGEGTGLGLSISYGIVKEHKATIEVESSYTQGANFSTYVSNIGRGTALWPKS